MIPSETKPSLLLVWGTTALAAALAVLWAGSMFCVVRIPVPNGTVRLCFGTADFHSPATAPPGFSITRWNGFPPEAWPAWGTLRGGPFVVVPLWIPAAAAAAVACALLVRACGVSPGHCRGCHYDMRATPDRCPECGRAADAAASGA